MEEIPMPQPRHRPLDEVLADVGGTLVGLGVVRMIVGLAAVALPLFPGAATGVVVGLLLVVAGVLHMAQAYRAEQWGTGFVGLFEGLAALAFGTLIFALPASQTGAVSVVALGYLLVAGLLRIATANAMRPLSGWVWAGLCGLVSVALAFYLLAILPVRDVATVGTLVGVDLLAGGWWTFASGLAGATIERRMVPA